MSVAQYYKNVNPHLLKMFPKRLERILEMGCGAGALGSAYKTDINQTCVYEGVELMDEPAAIAADHLDRVVVGNLEQLTNQDLGLEDQSLDCLVYGDVLEHLISPWDELKRRAPLLKSRGIVLTCIPNVAHWSILAKLIMGEWAYEDSGILDRTHLRFFNRSGIHELFEGAGYKITRIKGIPNETEWSEKFLNSLSECATSMGMARPQFKEESSYYQYVVKAVKP